MAAALLHLPQVPPTLIASVYAPCKSTRAHTDGLRNIIKQALQSPTDKFRSHILGGDFKTMITPSVDGHNRCSRPAWDWLACKMTSKPPRLTDSFRSFQPTQRVFTRSSQPRRSSEPRLDMNLYFPLAPTHITPRSADIHTHDRSTNHHPITYHAKAPPLPFRNHPFLKQKIFRKLKAQERDTFTPSECLFFFD